MYVCMHVCMRLCPGKGGDLSPCQRCSAMDLVITYVYLAYCVVQCYVTAHAVALYTMPLPSMRGSVPVCRFDALLADSTLVQLVAGHTLLATK